MGTRVVAGILAIAVVVFVGIFVWKAVWPSDPRDTIAAGAAPTAETSQQLSDGQIDVEVFVLGSQNIRVEIRFMPDADAVGAAGLRPDVNFAMLDMHMDGLTPPIELVEAGAWRVNVKLPMAGRWVVSAGFEEEFAEVEFDAR